MTPRGMIQRHDAAGFVTAADVHAAKLKLDPYVTQLDAIVRDCADLRASTRDTWAKFAAAWRDFFARSEGFFTAGSEMDQVQAYEADVLAWQRQISAECPRAQVVAPTGTGAAAQAAAAPVVDSLKGLLMAAIVLAAIVYGAPIVRDALSSSRAR